MQYKQLGASDLQVSALSFGCMSLRGPKAHDIQLLHQAMDAGINFFDTADLYDKGANEELVGKAFRGKREKVMLATKVGNQWRADNSGWQWNPAKSYILQTAEESLRRLQTDYIDLYQLHGGTTADPTDETIEAFELLKASGKIRHYGISSIRPNVVRRWMERSGLSSVMVQYSLLDRRPEETVLPLLQQKGTGVLVRGALAQGLLAGKPPKPYLEHEWAAVEKAAQAVAGVVAEGRTPTGTALQWVLAHGAVTSVVAGIRTGAQLKAALNGLSEPPLPPSLHQALSAAAPPLLYKEHR